MRTTNLTALTAAALIAVGGALLLLRAGVADPPPKVSPQTGAGAAWIDASFAAFSAGTFDGAGVNLYVSHAGVLQTVRRWDIDQNGTPDIIFDSTHDFSYQMPATVWSGGKAGLSAKPVLNLPTDGGKLAVMGGRSSGGANAPLLLINEFNGTWKKTGLRIFDSTAHGLNPVPRTTLFENAQVAAAALGMTGGGGATRPVSCAAFALVGEKAIRVYAGLDTVGNSKPLIVLPLANGDATSLVIANGYLYAASGGHVTRYALDLSGATAAAPAGDPMPGENVAKIVAADLEGSGKSGPTGSRTQSLLYLRDGGKAMQWLPGADPAAAPKDLPVSGAVGAAVGDFDGNGRPDIAVAAGNSVTILSASADGTTFQKTAELPAPYATAVAVGDWNADGHPDIAVACGQTAHTYEANSYVYWGGAAGFTAARRTAVPTEGATDVAVGDFTGHGKDDLLFVNNVRGQLEGKIPSYVYYSTRGKRTFRRQELPTIGAYESTIADFNDDGYPDVLIACAHENSSDTDNGSYIFWGGPHGLDAKHPTLLPTKGAISASVGDLNHDGYLDLTVSEFRTGALTIFWGGPKGWSRDRTTVLQTPDHKDPRFHLIADLNRDGYLDIVVPDIRKNTSVIYWGGPKGFSAARTTLIPGIGSSTAETADLNGDGWPDLILCNFWDPATQNQRVPSYIYWGGPKGFSADRRTELETIGCHDCAVADLNKDGYLDLVFSSYNAGPYRSLDSFIYWGGPNGYSAKRRTGLFNDSAAGILVADFDGDGWLDIAFANHTRGGDHRAQSRVFWGGPSGFSNNRVTFLPTIGPHQMSTADMGNIMTRKPEETFTSRIYHRLDSQQPSRLSWSADIQPGTAVTAQIRSAASLSALQHAAWLGATGPGSSFTTAGASLTALKLPGNYLQYRLCLKTGIAGNSPRVHRVEVDFAGFSHPPGPPLSQANEGGVW